MANLLLDIGIVMIVATALAYAAKILKQPLVLGYIVAGLIIGPSITGLITSTETITTLSELGIAFLLFIVGMEIDFNKIKDSGKKTAIMGAGQVAFTAIAGFAISALLGFTAIESFYIAIALTFSSTMIVIKLMADKGTLDTIYGRLVLGMLLIQDVIAIFVLALLPNLEHTTPGLIFLAIGKGAIIFATAFAAAKLLIPAIFRVAAKSTELLFLSAVSWLFAMSFFAELLGYSIAIGSFLAGVALASSSYSREVASRTKSLRDFFATIFFVSLGMQLSISSLGATAAAALGLSLFVILGNPLIVALLGLATGYNNRISILSGLPMGQVSEFSLIVIALGVSLGHISSSIFAVIVAIAAITITATTYVIKYDSQIYRGVHKLLRIAAVKEETQAKRQKFDVVLCGYNRIGFSIARKLKQLGKTFVVVDFDPDVISRLKQEKVPAIYGDLGDVEFLKSLDIPDSELVISTVPDLHDNQLIINEAKKGNTIAVATSTQIDGALKLYEYGASYVILPHFIGGEHMALLLEKFNHLPTLLQHKFSHIRELHKRRTLGYEHLP